MVRLRIVGPGRAGTSLALALTRRGCKVAPMLGRDDDLSGAARDVDLLVLATPDAAVGDVARAVEPVPDTVVAHLSGSLGLDVLASHPRRASVHPLVALPTPELGAKRLVGAWFAVAGDPLARHVVELLYGRAVEVPDEQRAVYHAAASIAANHLVALMGQVERVAEVAGVPFQAYLDLARAALADVEELGPVEALTGPVARGDEATVQRHLRALPPAERPGYQAMADAARVLVEARRVPASEEADHGRPSR